MIPLAEPHSPRIFVPDVLVPCFMSGNSLQFAHLQQPERSLRNQQNCPRVQSDGGLRHVNHRDDVHRVAFHRLKHTPDVCQLRQVCDTQTRDFALLRQRVDDTRFFLGGDRSGASGM